MGHIRIKHDRCYKRGASSIVVGAWRREEFMPMRFLFLNFTEEEHIGYFETFLIRFSAQTYAWPSFSAEDSCNTFAALSRAVGCEFSPLPCPSALCSFATAAADATPSHALCSFAPTAPQSCVIPASAPWNHQGIHTCCAWHISIIPADFPENGHGFPLLSDFSEYTLLSYFSHSCIRPLTRQDLTLSYLPGIVLSAYILCINLHYPPNNIAHSILSLASSFSVHETEHRVVKPLS